MVRELLTRHGLRPTKSLGQNFLIDGNILRFIVEASEIKSGQPVLEVGPGLGVLSQALLETGAQLTVIEKDERLRPVLEEHFGSTNLRLIFGDALKVDLTDFPPQSLFVSNLPYYISTAILSHVLMSGRFAQLTVLVQSEVAERITAKVGEANYGYLSALIACYGTSERLREVSKKAFYPEPQVSSSIVRIRTSGEAPSAKLLQLLEIVLHHRRKTVRNNLLLAGYVSSSIQTALELAGIPSEARGEVIELAQLRHLSALLPELPTNPR